MIQPELHKVRPALGGNFRLRCNVKRFLFPAAASSMPMWSHKDVIVSPQLSLPGLTNNDIRDGFQNACSLWNSICGIRLQIGSSGINILSRSGRIDGSYGTLAYSYMPDMPSTPSDQLEQLYDNAESWTIKWFQDVVLHELGHAIGLDHCDYVDSIMYPFSNGKWTKFHEWEIKQVQARYGIVQPQPQPQPQPLNISLIGNLVINNEIYKLDLKIGK